MSNFDTVVLDGEMGLFTKVREGDLPYYTGATEVTPSDTTQVLETADTIVTENITINPIPDMDLEEVQVTYTPDEEGQTDTITPSTGYVGIAEVEVTVEPIDSNYVGSGIARKDSDDLTASGASVIAPAGYYEEAAMKSVASGSATTPGTSITANPTISVGNDGSITATVSATQSITPTVSAGYVSSGTAGNITVSGSGSSQLSTQAGTTITPTTSQQTAVAAGKFTTGAVVVDAMPSGTAGTPTATKGTVSNHSVSVTPSVTNQTGYITGGTKTGTAVTVSASELVSGSQNITTNNTYDVTNLASVTVAVPSGSPTLETKSVSYTPTESQQTEEVTAGTGYDGLEKVNVTVGAISSSYVGSAIDRRDSTDLSASGATVTAPAGYYAAAASKSVASGTAGTPSATKGSVSEHSISVTPSVTNTAGYISGGTITGTPVTVDVAELESGTKTITENGTGISVSGYSEVDVNVSGGGGGNEDAILSSTYSGAYTNDSITQLGPAFRANTGLTSISLPNVTKTVGTDSTFAGCSGLTSAFLPKLSTANNSGNSFFSNCNLSTIAFPAFSGDLGQSVLYRNRNLTAFDLGPGVAKIKAQFADGCSVLATVVIRRTSVMTLDNVSALNNTPFASGGSGGTIYIPESLYNALGTGTNDYKAATNWSTVDGRGTITWAKIEGSYYETHYADGTTIPTS